MFCCPPTEFASAVYRYLAHSSVKRAVLVVGGAVVVVGTTWFTVYVPVTVWFDMHVSAAVMDWFTRHAAALIVWPCSLPTPEQPVPCMICVPKVVVVTVWLENAPAGHVHFMVWPVSF